MHLKKPWGDVKAYVLNQTCTVKLITLEAGQQTSLHYHLLRDDMWVILDDGLEVRIGEDVYQCHEGDEYVITAEQPHMIKSHDKQGRVLEINFGYTSEDDDHRLEDAYGREVETESRLEI